MKSKIKIISHIRSKLKNMFKTFTGDSSSWIDILSPDSTEAVFNKSNSLKYYRSYTFASINARAENTSKASEYGAVDLIIKPVDFVLLKEKMIALTSEYNINH